MFGIFSMAKSTRASDLKTIRAALDRLKEDETLTTVERTAVTQAIAKLSNVSEPKETAAKTTAAAKSEE